jgi:hypothetical protein
MPGSDYLYIDVSRIGQNYPFWIKKDSAILAHTQLCKTQEEVAQVLRSYLRGLWRKGYITSHEKLIFNNAAVSEAWDASRFRDKYLHWVEQVQVGEVHFKEPQ